MEKVFSIRELEGMIKAIKGDNPHYNKKIRKSACGIFKFNEYGLIEHRHVGIQEYKHLTCYNS